MPCICYGATSGKEDCDRFLASERGKEVMQYITRAAAVIMAHEINPEVEDMSVTEFRRMFVKCFSHIMLGCDG